MKVRKEFRGEKCAHLRASASSLRITFRLRNEAFPREILHFYLTLCAVKKTTTTKRIMAIPDTHANKAKLLSFLFALLALIVLLLAASKTTNTRTKDVENEDENGALLKRSDASALLKNVPENDDMRKKTYCAKVANVGEWFFGETACEYAQTEMDFAHSFDACDEGDEASGWWFERRRRRARRKEAKAWVPDEGLMDACQFFRFASATIQTSRSSFSSSSTSVAIDTDATATAVEVAKEAREEEEEEVKEEVRDENAENDFAIQRMMRGRDALFVGDSQVRHVYAAFLRVAAIGDAHEAHLHPPQRPKKLKNSPFNRKYRAYAAKIARKSKGDVVNGEEVLEEENIEAEVVGDIPGDKRAKTDPLKHRNWTFAIQGGGVAHFVWAPEARDVVEVVKERLLLDSDGESTKDSKFASPDFLVAGVGLWHMLHEADANDFQRQIAEVKALLDDIDFKTTVPFWLTVSKPGPSHLMNSVKKQTHLTEDSWASYREATEKEFSDDVSQTLAIDFGALTEKCGPKCSVDGVHVDETAYDAAAQILLNALASLWDVKIPNFRFSSKRSQSRKSSSNSQEKDDNNSLVVDPEEDSEYEPLDFKEPSEKLE